MIITTWLVHLDDEGEPVGLEETDQHYVTENAPIELALKSLESILETKYTVLTGTKILFSMEEDGEEETIH